LEHEDRLIGDELEFNNEDIFVTIFLCRFQNWPESAVLFSVGFRRPRPDSLLNNYGKINNLSRPQTCFQVKSNLSEELSNDEIQRLIERDWKCMQESNRQVNAH
jgi:hypothetical protein